jgi:hypothetical protein
MNDQRRKPGQKLKTGEIKGEILKYALKYGGMFEEPTLKDAIEEKFKIRRGTVKKKHLAVLEARGILSKTEEPGHPNIWRIKEDRETILLIYKEHPQLIQHLQQSDFILNCIANGQSSLFDDKKAFEELKKMLRLSPRMFESCLKIDDFESRYRHIIDQAFITRDPSLCFTGNLSDQAYMAKYFSSSPSKEMKEMSHSDMIQAYETAYESAMRAGETHLARWDLFRSCVKTDDIALLDEKDYHELYDMFMEEEKKRAEADRSYVEGIERRVEDKVKRELSQQNREG